MVLRLIAPSAFVAHHVVDNRIDNAIRIGVFRLIFIGLRLLFATVAEVAGTGLHNSAAVYSDYTLAPGS